MSKPTFWPVRTPGGGVKVVNSRPQFRVDLRYKGRVADPVTEIMDAIHRYQVRWTHEPYAVRVAPEMMDDLRKLMPGDNLLLWGIKVTL